jgi:hypothetical protein
MKPFRRALSVITAVAASGAALTVGASPAGAASVKVQGSLGAAQAGYTVLMVTPGGTAVAAKTDSSGKFVITTSKALAKKASLQLVDTKNRYAGPVVIAKEKVGSAWCSKARLSGVSVNLGTLSVKGGAAIPKKAPKMSTYMSTAIPAKSSAGLPAAAGTGGIVKMSYLAAKKKSCSKSKNGVKGASAFDAEPVLGADLDVDGIPNALDADDDGDQVIDAVDQTTTVTAAMNPWVSLRSSNPLYNANISPSLSAADITAVLGTSGNYQVQFFIGQNNLVSGDKASTLNSVKYAWVDCGELVYCGGTAPTARTTQTHLINNNTGVEWSTYGGGFTVEDKSAPATSGLDQTLGTNPGGKNSLFLNNRNRAQDPNNVYWLASMFPNQGAQTLDTMKPGDVYTVRYALASGEEKSVVMMLNPHAVTVPGITKVNDTAFAGGALTADSSGKVKVEFFRPQRLVTTGESGTFKDMGGLRYGFIYSPQGGNDTGCGVTNYSGYDTQFTAATGTDMAERLWPLYDKQSEDSDSGTSATKLTMTLDVKGCIGSAWDSAASGTSWSFQLVGAGQSLTGGSNRAALDLTIKKP